MMLKFMLSVFTICMTVVVGLFPVSSQTDASDVIWIVGGVNSSDLRFYRIDGANGNPQPRSALTNWSIIRFSLDERWVVTTGTGPGYQSFNLPTGSLGQYLLMNYGPQSGVSVRLDWLPDSSMFLYTVLNDPSFDGRPYGGAVDPIVPSEGAYWDYRLCNQVAQMPTGRFALICTSDEPSLNPGAVAVYWDATSMPFDPLQDRILIDDINALSTGYIWQRDESQREILIRVLDGGATSDLLIQTSDGATSSIQASGSVIDMALSPDQQTLAVLMRQTDASGGSQDCLATIDVSLDDPAFTESGFCASSIAIEASFAALSWYNDGESLAIAVNSELGSSVWRFETRGSISEEVVSKFSRIDDVVVAKGEPWTDPLGP